MNRTPTVLAIIVAALCLATFADQPTSESKFKTRSAIAAEIGYERSIRDIDEKYHSDRLSLQHHYLQQLKSLLIETTKAGNVDESIRIRTEIDAIEQAASAPTSKLIDTEWRLWDGRRWKIVSKDKIKIVDPDGTRRERTYAAVDDRRIASPNGDDRMNIIVFNIDLSAASMYLYPTTGQGRGGELVGGLKRQ